MQSSLAALLLVAGCLLLTPRGCLGSKHPCAAATSSELAWSCIQSDRIKRLDSFLLSLVYDPSNLVGSTVQGYVQQRPVKSAEDLLLYASFSAEAKSAPLPIAVEASANDEWYATEAASETDPVLPKPSRKRQLLQFPHARLFTNLEQAGNQIMQETVSFLDPSGALHSYSNSYSRAASATAGPLSAVAARSMQLPVVLSALAGPGQLKPLQPTLRIVGGVEAPTDRKYVCSLRTATDSNSNFLYCGCSLIAPGVVVTAAHCVMDLRTPWVEISRYYQQRPNDTTVNDYDRIKCAASVINSKWGVDNNAQGDIALCFLETPSRFDPVKLADTTNTKLTAGQELTVMGWGATSEGGPQANSLMTVNVTTTDLKTCNSAFDNKIDAQTQLCAGVLAGGRDACQGDSGGPLVISGETAEDDVQVGIVSFGIGCARPNLPGVYTDVRAYRQWIAQQLLGRSIKYAPLTDGYTADVKVVDQKAACACTTDGRSGSARLPNDLSGCKQHSLNMGDTEYYCYTRAGTECAAATPSNTYAGAAWVDCTPSVAESRGPATATPTTTAPTSAASLLGSLVGQWLATPRDGPSITMPFAGNGTAARNRTVLLSRRAALPAARG